jgi:hypothetical protein
MKLHENYNSPSTFNISFRLSLWDIENCTFLRDQSLRGLSSHLRQGWQIKLLAPQRYRHKLKVLRGCVLNLIASATFKYSVQRQDAHSPFTSPHSSLHAESSNFVHTNQLAKLQRGIDCSGCAVERERSISLVALPLY